MMRWLLNLLSVNVNLNHAGGTKTGVEPLNEDVSLFVQNTLADRIKIVDKSVKRSTPILFLCCRTLIADRTDRAYNFHFTVPVLFCSYCVLSIVY